MAPQANAGQDAIVTPVAPELKQVPCPRCGASQSAVIHRARDYLYGLPGEFFASECARCGLWFQNPRPPLAQAHLLYPEHYAPHRMAERSAVSGKPPAMTTRVRRALRRFERLRAAKRAWSAGYTVHALGYRDLEGVSALERIAGRLGSWLSPSAGWRACVELIPGFVPHGRLLEIGCGTGSHLARLRGLGWRNLHGVELSTRAGGLARELGFDVQVGAVEDTLPRFPDAHFDVIVSSMVLEHLVNPFTVLRTIASKLKPGGELLFSTVIRDSLDGRMFGKYGVCFDFPRHMVFFLKSDLLDMLAADFERIQDCHQCTPIDFTRPAGLRKAPIDNLIEGFFRLPGTRALVQLLAWCKMMGRVSFRCRRRGQTVTSGSEIVAND